MRISITKTKEEVCNCNSCNAASYDAVGTKRVGILYDVKVGNTVCVLCVDCLKALSEMANKTLSITKVRIVYKEGTIWANEREDGVEIREYDNYEDAEKCVKDYQNLPHVKHVHFVD